jgi:hypothetical protein
MAVKVKQEYVKAIGSISPETDGIQLPYVAPLAWWTNKRSNNENDGVDYFGGWAMKLDDYDNGVAEYGPLPNWYDSDGGDIGPLKTCRSVLIAPFGARKRWMSKDKGDRKTGNHLLQLAYVAYVGDDRKVIPWGPMILSMKVTTVMEYEKLLKEWSVTTYDARHEFAGGAPAHFFYMPIGSFGEKPILSIAGKEPYTSKVTHPQVYQYPRINEALTDYLYVGDAVCGWMAEFKEQSREWLNDKKWSENNNDADEDSTRASELSELPVPEAQTAPVDPGWDDSAEEDLFPAF